ncbi:MAG: adenylate/guanylate cyclase domain-containing protein [Chloroflexota bacterium]
MPELPRGTVTFLFTDLEDSTRLWEQHPEAMKHALARHDALLRRCVEQNRGVVVKTTGDGCHAVFARAGDGVAAALAGQRALAEETWDPEIGRLLVRMSLHTGTAEVRAGDYYGSAVNRAARLMSVAHGGQILLSQITRELVEEHLPDSVDTIDLGRHRLRGLVRPETIFQLVTADLPSTFPPLRTLDVQPTNLPVQTTPFVGREEEIATLSDLLAQPGLRLVTLVGPGGAGKTRLATEAAAQQTEHFEDGVFFVGLAPLDDADQIVQSIIEALSIAITSGENLEAQLLRNLRRKRLLLVMDNFEHLLDGARLVNDILSAASGVTILATSRERLNLTGESVLVLGGLAFGDWRTPEEVLSHSAGQLFVQSAQRSQPGFQLMPADVHYVSRICQLVEGMPLAILLAAAWADTISPGEIAAEIERSLDFLETDLRDIPARQHSIRAIFEGSWERLAAPDRELFKKLSVFRGGFTREASVEAAGASLRGLARLVNKSFLRRDPDRDRYEIHELLRQFAAERLAASAEASAAAREAHTAYFTGLMEQMIEPLRSERQKAALDEIEADIENVRSAWQRLVSLGRATEINRIIETVWYFHEVRCWYHAGLELFGSSEASLRAMADDEENEVVCAQFLAIRGAFTTFLGSPQHGRKMAQEALTTLRRFNRRKESLIALFGLAVSNLFSISDTEIGQSAREMLEIGRELGDRWWETLGLTMLGSANMWAGLFEAARPYAERAAEGWARIGDPWGAIWPGTALAGLAVIDGDLAAAKERYLFVLGKAQSVNFKRGLQYTYTHLGNASFAAEAYREAEDYYLQSLAISDEIGQTREMLATCYDIARVRAVTGGIGEAVQLLGTVLNHPAREQRGQFRPATIREDAERLRMELKRALDPETYAAAWRQGEAAELDAVVAGLLD